MKKIIITLLFLLLFGCAPNYEINKQILISGFDFTKYTDKGFLFTPEQYLGNYESIGLVQVEIFPGIERIKLSEKAESKENDTWSRPEYQDNYRYSEEVNPEEVLDSLLSVTKSMGADAVVRLEIERINKQYYNFILPGIKAYGFAIKRK